MPAVTVFSSPKGEPIAITHSPTRSRATSPMRTVGKRVASILTTATSVRRSAPTTRAVNSRSSLRVTTTSSAPSTTCALVKMKPSAVRMKPEPTPRGRSTSGPPSCGPCGPRGAMPGGSGMPKRRKNSCIWSSGEPLRRTRSMVRMLTTAGPTWSTNTVKSGRPRTSTGALVGALRAGAACASVLEPAALVVRAPDCASTACGCANQSTPTNPSAAALAAR